MPKQPPPSRRTRSGLSALRPLMLCAVFGAVAAQGVLRAAPAHAHGQEPEPQTAASAELARMADYYNQLLDTDQPILYLDPDRLQTLPQEPTFDDLARMIGRDGVTPTLDALERLDSSITTTPGPYSAVNADYGLEHELLMPYALAGLPSDGGTFCLAVAGVDHAVVRGLDGMTAEQAVRFFNRHEFWHCVGDTVLEAHGAARDGSERRFTRAFYEHKARVLSSETMADLGAVADMIAEDGDGLEIVQSVSIWRARRFFAEQRDIDHFSSPALIVFAQEIEAMGIDAFRQRGAAARLEMITRSTRENRISPAVLALLDQHRHGVNADHMRPSASERALAEKVAGLMRQVGSITHDDFEFIVLSEDQGAELARFDARGRLERAARGEAEGPLSRHAVLAARARLLDELRRALRETPDDPLIGARIILTHRAAAGLLHDAATETSSYRPATVGAGHPVAGS